LKTLGLTIGLVCMCTNWYFPNLFYCWCCTSVFLLFFQLSL